jgi:hypothetical protein
MRELAAVAWRVIYALLTGRLAVAIALGFLRVYAALRGAARAEGLIGLIDRRYAFSGWPYYGRGWTNLHVSRFTADLRRHRRGVRPAPPRRATRGQLQRVACIGSFVGLLGFPRELLARCPVELVIADVVFDGRHAAYLAGDAARYQQFDLREDADVDRLAAFVNGCEPDLVVNIGHKVDAFAIMDRLNAPCLANYCAGSDLLHHPRVDVQYHGQPEADYFVTGNRMFCGTTASFFGDGLVHTINGYIDPRGLMATPPRSWSDRDPLIVCHGSLYKFTADAFLDVVLRWLRSNDELTLVLMGRDDGAAWQTISAAASRRGVGERVTYLGQFSAIRGEDGAVNNEGWRTLVDLLSRARLAPNPFPLGGGSSRYEAYALGAPAPHLGVKFDRAAWGRPQPSICEIPSLLVEAGTAWTVDDYHALGQRCLTDGAFADTLAAAQRERAAAVVDGDRWWREIVDGYEGWRRTTAARG